MRRDWLAVRGELGARDRVLLAALAFAIPLAVTGFRRLAALRDVPTLAEQGIEDPRANSWWGFVGPRGLPPAIVERLNREITAVLRDPAVVAAFQAMSIEPSPGTPADFQAYIESQYAHWRTQARELAVELR